MSGTVAEVVVMTRLAQEPISPDKARVTFDEIGGKTLLEAIWPGVDDGYLLWVTKEKHTHPPIKLR